MYVYMCKYICIYILYYYMYITYIYIYIGRSSPSFQRGPDPTDITPLIRRDTSIHIIN